MKLQINGEEVELAGHGVKAQYKPQGELLALEPKAFGLFFDMPEHDDEPELTDDGVVVIDIIGPLMHQKSFWFDSYDAIKARVAAAIALSPRIIILAIDSPGGVVSGAFDTARAIRRMTEDAQVNTYAHVTGVGASAAYALATAASYIGVSETAMIGSIGVLDMLVDATEHNALHGINVKLIASGQRKTDGHPDEPMSEGAIKATQARVDELASMFFALVEEHGYGKQDDLRAMQTCDQRQEAIRHAPHWPHQHDRSHPHRSLRHRSVWCRHLQRYARQVRLDFRRVQDGQSRDLGREDEVQVRSSLQRRWLSASASAVGKPQQTDARTHPYSRRVQHGGGSVRAWKRRSWGYERTTTRVV